MGVDSSPHQIQMAREDAEQRGVGVQFLQMDMSEMVFDGEFDAVLNLPRRGVTSKTTSRTSRRCDGWRAHSSTGAC